MKVKLPLQIKNSRIIISAGGGVGWILTKNNKKDIKRASFSVVWKQ